MHINISHSLQGTQQSYFCLNAHHFSSWACCPCPSLSPPQIGAGLPHILTAVPLWCSDQSCSLSNLPSGLFPYSPAQAGISLHHHIFILIPLTFESLLHGVPSPSTKITTWVFQATQHRGFAKWERSFPEHMKPHLWRVSALWLICRS